MRFPEFKDEWKEVRLGEVAEKQHTKNTDDSIDRVYTNSAQNGIVEQTEFFDKEIANGNNLSGYYIVKQYDFVYNPRLSRTAPVGAMNINKNTGTGLVSPLYTVFRITNRCVINEFLEFLFKSTSWHGYMNEVANFGARSDRMNIRDKDFFNLPLRLPSLPEQRKIASLLSLIDERIETQSAVIKDQEALKGVLSKRLLTPEEDWMELAIRDCLTYEQPTKYIVRSTAYSSDSTLTPVLTANKGFILGYTNEQETYQKGACIIFDDFTLDCKYVPFAFKVKSSAIKILQAKEGFDVRFMFEVIKSLSLSPLAHKRHYISEVEPIKVLVPSFAKQEKIVRLFAALDERLAIEKEYAALLQKQKAYLLQQMFV